jgi:NAD(P)H dehydrogenase (quinone)
MPLKQKIQNRSMLMQISLILAHPDPSSFNHALAQSVLTRLKINGYHVNYHDLCQEGFSPDLPAEEILKTAILPDTIQSHCDEIRLADGVVIIHPNWWGQPPAVLKGWIDRVLRPGVAYQFVGTDKGEGVPVGLLKAQTALVVNTSNTADDREQSVFGDPLETIWKNCIFGLCGVKTVRRKVFRVVVTSSLNERHNWLKEVEKLTEDVFGIAY